MVDLAHLAALLGIRTWHPDDADLAVLRELLARRETLAERHRADDSPPAEQPYRHWLR